MFVIETAGNISSYKWRKNGTDLTDDARITGSSGPVLNIPDLTVADSGVYTCYVEGACANDVSNPARLQVNKNTTITAQPASTRGVSEHQQVSGLSLKGAT